MCDEVNLKSNTGLNNLILAFSKKFFLSWEGEGEEESAANPTLIFPVLWIQMLGRTKDF